MQSERGFTLIEILVTIALIGIISAMAIPNLSESTRRNSVWTASEQIGSQIRQARLQAITRNQRFRVTFDCPAADQYRVLAVQGNALLDNAADRCLQSYTHDSGIYTLPQQVTFGDPPTLEVNGRGVYSIIGVGVLPLPITVQYAGVNVQSRQLTVSITGQITFAAY